MIKSIRLRWAGHLARMGEGRGSLKIVSGKPTGKRPLGRPRCRWEDNIRIELKERGINTRDLVDSDLDRDYWSAVMNAALNLWVS